MITVGQLIEKLQQMDLNAEITDYIDKTGEWTNERDGGPMKFDITSPDQIVFVSNEQLTEEEKRYLGLID